MKVEESTGSFNCTVLVYLFICLIKEEEKLLIKKSQEFQHFCSYYANVSETSVYNFCGWGKMFCWTYSIIVTNLFV